MTDKLNVKTRAALSATLTAAGMALLLAVVGLASAARAQGDTDSALLAEAQAAITEVITDQIAAFGQNDLARAFDHASPSIRQMFGSAERFGAMVQNGYPLIWQPGELRFGALTLRDGRLMQTVIVSDSAGQVQMYDYEMLLIGDGWRINGVFPHQAEVGV